MNLIELKYKYLQIKLQLAIIKTNKSNMIEPIYLQDPNEYIKSLSKVKLQIQKRISHQIKTKSSSLDNELQRQLSRNLFKYKKNYLTNERIKFSKEKQQKIQEQKKISLDELIQNKIKMSQQFKAKSINHSVQKRKMQRLMKQAIIKSRKQEIRKNNLKKSLQIIERIEQKSDDYSKVPIRLKMLEQKLKNSRQINIRRATSQTVLPKIHKSTLYLTETNTQQQTQSISRKEKHDASKSKQIDFSRMQKSPSLTLIRHSNHTDIENDEQILSKLIQQNSANRINDYNIKNSLSYKATHLPRHRQVKQAIQGYLQTMRSSKIS